MSIFRVNKTKNFTVISNFHLKDKNLSLKAKGLLSIMLSLPDDWDFTIAGLVSLCQEGEKAVTNALKELRECGYLRVRKEFPKKGSNSFKYSYDIFEQSSLDPQNVGLQNVGLQNGGLNKILNNKILNNKKIEEEKNEDLEEVYETYLTAFGKTTGQFKLTPKRRDKISARLRDAGKEMLLKAIRNCSKDSFYRGKNERKWKADLDFITRSYEKVEYLANLESSTAPSDDGGAIVIPDHLQREMDFLKGRD